MPKGAPPNVDWREIAEAAQIMALEHLEAARALLAARKHPQAVSIAILGYEELGKYFICLEVLLMGAEPDTTWKRLSDHAEKLRAVRSFASLVTPDVPVPGALAALMDLLPNDNRLKQQGFYVDWQDGKVVTPLDIDEATALSYINHLAQVVSKTNEFDISLGLARLPEIDMAAMVAENRTELEAFIAHLKTLPTEEAELLASKTMDEIMVLSRKHMETLYEEARAVQSDRTP